MRPSLLVSVESSLTLCGTRRESILGSTELQLASRAQQVGFWARVNSVLLDGPMGQEVGGWWIAAFSPAADHPSLQALAQILTIPHLPARLLALLPFCSPINDLLLLLLRVSRTPSPLIPSTVTQTIRMLDPFSALGKPGHAAAEELLRGIIEICLAVPRPQGGPGGAPFGGMGAGPGAGEEPVFEWRDTTLARKIADEKSVRTLLDWVLAGQDEVTDAAAKGDTVKHSQGGAQEDAEEATPVPPSVEERKGAAEEDVIGADEGRDEQDDDARQRELRTSSLISSLAVFTELIRKNNSDFVEQQMLTWARRRQAAQAERELLEADGAEIVRDPRDEEEERLDDKGPSVVDLGTMLSLVARRIGEFQQLVKKPRSSVRAFLPNRSPGWRLTDRRRSSVDCTRSHSRRYAFAPHPRAIPHLRVLRRAPSLFQHVPPQPHRPLRRPVRRERPPRTRFRRCRRARGCSRRSRAVVRRRRARPPARSAEPRDRRPVRLFDQPERPQLWAVLRHVDAVGPRVARRRVGRRAHQGRGEGAQGDHRCCGEDRGRRGGKEPRRCCRRTSGRGDDAQSRDERRREA